MEEIEQQAARWILRCDGQDCGEEDRAALEAWLAGDTRHREAYLRLDEAWGLTEGLKQWRPGNGVVNLDVLVGRARLWRPRHGLGWALAAAVAAFVVGAMAWTQWSKWVGTRYSTPVGGYERVALADGTVLQLNTDTRVRVLFSDTRREVRLLQGEAYFDVAHETARPFEVRVGGTVARALGTAFSIRKCADERVELVVTQGKVVLLQGGLKADPPLVVAGQSAQAKAERVAVAPVAREEIKRDLAWQTGQLVFDKEPLSQVAEEFNRYNRRQVRVGSKELNSLEITGNFKATDLHSFVAAVESAMPVRVEESGDAMMIWTR